MREEGREEDMDKVRSVHELAQVRKVNAKQ